MMEPKMMLHSHWLLSKLYGLSELLLLIYLSFSGDAQPPRPPDRSTGA